MIDIQNHIRDRGMNLFDRPPRQTLWGKVVVTYCLTSRGVRVISLEPHWRAKNQGLSVKQLLEGEEVEFDRFILELAA